MKVTISKNEMEKAKKNIKVELSFRKGMASKFLFVPML